MKNVALITGASGGIGEGLARIHAAKGGDLVLVARSKDRLQELKQELETKYSINVWVILKDLSQPGSPLEVYREVQHRGIEVQYLINNAGFGDFGKFTETHWEKEESMIKLNIIALTHLTKLFLKEMVSRKRGRILNVASTAAFQPGPLMAVYYATKHYVLAFSQGVAGELKGTGVTITTLCPGPTASGFQKKADMEESRMVKNVSLPSAFEVAEFGYRKMMNGSGVVVHGFMNRLMAGFAKMLPSSFTAKVARKLQEKV